MTSYTGFIFRNQYYVVNERGSGNLSWLMEIYRNGKQIGVSYDWIVQQFGGLAGALAKIHGPTNGNIGFHHDIKPDNILLFAENDKSIQNITLKLCDWGCARMDSGDHHEVTWANPGYKPPEAYDDDDPVTSTPHDIWSLGCVFLEVLIWFHEGAPKRAKFVRCHEEDNWAETSPGSSDSTVAIKSTVVEKIDKIGGKGENWRKITNEIRKMLHVDPQNPSKASDIIAALQ